MIISLTHICVTRPQWVNTHSHDAHIYGRQVGTLWCEILHEIYLWGTNKTLGTLINYNTSGLDCLGKSVLKSSLVNNYFFNMASDWLIVMRPANWKPGLKPLVNWHEYFSVTQGPKITNFTSRNGKCILNPGFWTSPYQYINIPYGFTKPQRSVLCKMVVQSTLLVLKTG